MRLSWPRRIGARWAFALWAALLLVLQLQGLGDAALFDVDEGAFSEATREMLASGDWGHTTLNGEPRFDKPILTYWLQAASVSLFGLDEAALRLPSALAAWGWAVAVAWFGWQRWGLRAGLAAGSILATCVGVALIGRAATADALLNLWLTLAMLDLWRALEQGPAADPRLVRRPLRRCAVWIALGLLTKGPVALLVPGATLVLWLSTQALRPGLAGAWQRWLALMRPLLSDKAAWALLLGIALPWYAYALHRHGMAFVDGFLWRHNLQRYGGTLEGHAGAWFYYLLLLPVLLFPWSALLLPLLARLRSSWPLGLPRFLLLWAGFVLVFFSGSGTKLPHYLLYGFTPLALLAGRLLVRSVDDAKPARLLRLTRGLLVLSLCAWPLLGIGLSEWARGWVRAQEPTPASALYRALLVPPASTWLLWLAASGVAMLAWCLCHRPHADPSTSAPTSRPPDAAWFVRAALAAGLGVLFMAQGLVPWWSDRLQAPVREMAGQVRRLQGTSAHDTGAGVAAPAVVQWGLHLPSFAVYLEQASPRRAPRQGELALVRSDQLPALAAQHRRAASAASAVSAASADPVRPAWVLLHSRHGLSLIRWLGEVPAGLAPAETDAPARAMAQGPGARVR